MERLRDACPFINKQWQTIDGCNIIWKTFISLYTGLYNISNLVLKFIVVMRHNSLRRNRFSAFRFKCIHVVITMYVKLSSWSGKVVWPKCGLSLKSGLKQLDGVWGCRKTDYMIPKIDSNNQTRRAGEQNIASLLSEKKSRRRPTLPFTGSYLQSASTEVAY